MKIKDVFESISNGGVRAKRRVRIQGPGGGGGEIGPGSTFNALSGMGGVTGQWITDHMEEAVPASWTIV